MNIGVIGVGGVGGYFGGKLAKLLDQNTTHDVEIYFIARNKHLEEIKNNGLILRTVDEGEIVCRPTLATDNIHELPTLDLCLICVKGFDLTSVLKELKCKIKDDTNIVPLLNGVDIYERVRAVISNGVIYPSCVYIGTHIEKPGIVAQNGGSCTILLGDDPQHSAKFPEKMLELFDAANIKYKWCQNPFEEIWNKYIFIAAYGMVTASENKTFGQILEDKKLSETVKGIMKEIAEIANKREVILPATIVEDSFNKAKNFPYETKTSFQRDFEHKNKPDEGELFGDTIIRLGEATGADTTNTKLVNDKIKRMR